MKVSSTFKVFELFKLKHIFFMISIFSLWWQLNLKVLANEDPLLRTHCCRHKCFPVCPRVQHLLRTKILCPQEMFPSLRCMEAQHSFCVPRIYAPKKHHEQQCVRNYVSSFASTLTHGFHATHSNEIRKIEETSIAPEWNWYMYVQLYILIFKIMLAKSLRKTW